MGRLPRSLCLSLALAMGALACEGEEPTPPDASTADGGMTRDASAADAEPEADAGALDAETSDADAPDSTPADVGTSSSAWERPACAQIAGTAGFSFTADEGRTLAPTATPLVGTAYSYGLAPLEAPNTILLVHDGTLLRSLDSGCTWTALGAVTGGFPASLAAAGIDRAYAWSDNNPELHRIDDTIITALGQPVTNVLGLAVDAADPDRVRIGDGSGQLWESTNAGDRFAPIGVPAFPNNGLVYRVAFDPSDLDHVLAGAAVEAARVTFDGGQTWTQVRGLVDTSTRGAVNAFSIAISPADGGVVWLQGLDLNEGGLSEGRHIWRSIDGGLTFSQAVTRTATVTLINGTLLAPHPTEPNVLYFVFGTYFQGYGTDLFRYDARGGQLTVEHNPNDDINAISFMPGDPGLMLLGLTSEM